MRSDVIHQPVLLRPKHLLRLAIILSLAFAAAAVFGQAPAAVPASPAAVAPPPATAPATPAAPAADDPAALLPNGRVAIPGVLTGGQPGVDSLQAIAAAGYKVLVNLRPASEAAPDLAEKAQSVGLRYVSLPIAGAADLTDDNVQAIGKLITARAEAPVAIYCATGNRAGALLALEQAKVEKKKAAEALATGKAAGLTRLEANVRELLGLSPW